MKGVRYLRLIWRVYCAGDKCMTAETVGDGGLNLDTARRLLRENGWVWHRRKGWLCPDCAGKVKEAIDNA